MGNRLLLLFVLTSVNADTGSDPQSCPLKCDVVAEMQMLRMSANQDSLMRMGMKIEMDKNFHDTKESLQTIKNTSVDNSVQINNLEANLSRVEGRLAQCETKLKGKLKSCHY